MSVFKVALNNVNQGLLDKDPSTAVAGAGPHESGTGSQISPSLQRSVYVTGPNLVNRLLIDGATFTDCNYWKRFAFPQVPYNEAFIQVVSDDGSVYSDVPGENTYPVVFKPGTGGVIAAGAGPDDTNMTLDIAGDYGGFASFVQITNTDGTDSVQVRLNGLTGATFTLAADSTQIFNAGDLSISEIAFDNSASGTAEINAVEVLLSIRSVCNS